MESAREGEQETAEEDVSRADFWLVVRPRRWLRVFHAVWVPSSPT